MQSSVEEVLAESPVFDGHNDLPWALRSKYSYNLDSAQLCEVNPALHTDLPSLRAGGVGAQCWSVYVPSNMAPHAAVSATLEQIDCVYQLIDSFSDQLSLATTSAETEEAMRSGKIASLLGMEGGHSIDESLGLFA